MNIQAVTAAKPDLIVDVGTVNETYVSLANKVQERKDVPYVLIDGRFSRTQDSLRQVELAAFGNSPALSE
ncbi:hypothetical protein [Rhizobium sp. RAF56]|uniref:hypothetical protein n=1 Tax=Rhizobium sp. RAF56 TaxID=3233062 RepID=UPI003F9A8EED